MKNLILLAILYLIPVIYVAQNDTIVNVNVIETGDTTIVKFGNKKLIVIENGDKTDVSILKDTTHINFTDSIFKKDYTHWAGIDLGMNGYFFGDNFNSNPGDNEYLELDYARSRSIAFNIFEPKLKIVGDYFGIFTGLGLEYNSYKLLNDYTLKSDNDGVFAVKDSTIILKKNKLRTSWINVPLMLELNTSKNTHKNFHMALGVTGSWRLGTKYKQKYTREGNREKSKSGKSFNMENYRVQASARLGYRDFTVFANYSLTPLFIKDKGPEIYPFSVGVSLINF